MVDHEREGQGWPPAYGPIVYAAGTGRLQIEQRVGLLALLGEIGSHRLPPKLF
jgi:hypothetical protein